MTKVTVTVEFEIAETLGKVDPSPEEISSLVVDVLEDEHWGIANYNSATVTDIKLS